MLDINVIKNIVGKRDYRFTGSEMNSFFCTEMLDRYCIPVLFILNKGIFL